MCFAFTILHRRVMGENDEEEQTSEILSFRRAGESGARVQDEESRQRKSGLKYQQRRQMRVSKARFVRG